jgi:hypothetical protein
MAVERPPCSLRLPCRINVQHDPRDLAPVSTFGIGIKHAHIGDRVLLIVSGEHWTGRRQIGNIRIKRAVGRSSGSRESGGRLDHQEGLRQSSDTVALITCSGSPRNNISLSAKRVRSLCNLTLRSGLPH